MPCYTEEELASEIGTCIIPANKSDVIRILADLCESITAIEAMFLRRQRNKNNAVTTMVANIETAYQLDDLVIIQEPLGSFVAPNSIVAQYDGLYRITYDVDFLSNGNNNQSCEFRIKIDGTTDFTVSTLSAATTVNLSGEIYRRLEAGDIISTHALVATNNRTSDLTIDVEYMLP